MEKQIKKELENSFKKHRLTLYISLFFTIIMALILPVSSYFMSPIIDNLIKKEDQTLLKNIGILGGFLGILVFLEFITGFLELTFFKIIKTSIKNDVLENLTRKNLFSWNGMDDGTKIAIFQNHIDDLVVLLYNPITKLTKSFFEILASIIVIGILSPIALSYVIPLFIIGVLLSLKTVKMQDPLIKVFFETSNNITKNIVSSFENISYFKRVDTSQNWISKFDNNEKTIEKGQRKYASLIWQIISINSVVSVLMNSLVVATSLLLIIFTDFILLVHLIPIVMLSKGLFAQSLNLITVFAWKAQGKSMKNQITDLANHATQDKMPIEKFEKLLIDFIDIKLDNTKLKTLNLLIKNNEKILIKGPNGIGKSFILKSISGNTNEKLIEHKNLLNNQKIPNLYCLINMFNFVSNEHFFFDGSVLDNLTFKNKSLENEAIELLNLFNLSHINANQVIDKNNVSFSEGEKQRLNLIRGIINKKPILILDEALTNLDLNNKKIVLNYISKQKNQAILMVNHNLEKELYGYFDKTLEINAKGEWNV